MKPFPYYKCRFCGAHNDRYLGHCPSCQRSGAMVRPDYVKEKDDSWISSSTLEDVDEPEGERIKTGISGLDRVLGINRSDNQSGLHIPGCTIFGGGHGCGKTTLLLTMLALTKERDTLLLHTEQSLGPLKASLVGIGLGHKARRIRAYALSADDNRMSAAIEKIDELNPRVVVVDSINLLQDDITGAKGRMDRLVGMITYFKTHSDEHRRAIIMTAHLTKDDSIGGRREQLHVGDTVMMLERIDDRIRKLHCPEKNRFGPITEKAYFEMGRNGMKELHHYAEPTKTKTSIKEDREYLRERYPGRSYER